MAEVGTFYQSKYTGEQLDEILKNVYDAVPLDGSKPMTGALDIKKVENGYSRFNKNHTQTTDLGTELKDISKGGSVVALLLKAADQAARLQFGTSAYDLIHSGNIQPYVKPFADAAEAASEEAAAALAGVRDAINNIPEGAATPIVNDLTTGGTSMALSAEMGKELKTELDGLTYTDVDAAPAGYGLGEYTKQVYSLAEVTGGGFYQLAGDFLPTGSGWWGYATIVSPNYGDLTCVSVEGCLIHFNLNGGVWQPFEWVNPPMELGFEYRTTERYNGKPVYTKLVDLGALPNSGTKTVSTGTDGTYIKIDGVITNISTDGNITKSALPLVGETRFRVRIAVRNNLIQITTTEDMTNWTGTASLKYTKE